MKDLSVIRQELDQLDRQLVALFEQRMVISRDVARYKIAQGLPVLDEAREAQVIQSRRAMLAESHWAADVEALFETVMACSRREKHALLNQAKEAEQQ